MFNSKTLDIYNSLNLVNIIKAPLFISIAKYTPWPNEIPPIPTSDDPIEEVGFIEVIDKQLATRHDCGPREIDGQRWLLTKVEDVVIKQGRVYPLVTSLYLRFQLRGSDLNITNYRTFNLYAHTRIRPNAERVLIYPPSLIEDKGIRLWTMNMTPTIVSNRSQQIELLVDL